MELYSVLVTGANRGIGLEFVRQLSRLPKPPRFIFATYRSEDTLGPLTDIKNASKECQVVLIKMDVQIPEDVVAARKVIEQTVGENGITLLINNSGVAKRQPFPEITEENLLYHFTINTVGPVRVFQVSTYKSSSIYMDEIATRNFTTPEKYIRELQKDCANETAGVEPAFHLRSLQLTHGLLEKSFTEMLPLLQKAAARASTGLRISRAAVLNISAALGSITQAGDEFTKNLGVVGYQISKAALNMAMKVISSNVKDQGILVISMCPGWVKTDMGTEQAIITPEDSICAMLQTLQKLDDSHQGSFMDRFGNLYPF